MASLDLLFFIAGWTHVVLAPYTKVEESFNLHALHDVLLHGIGRATLYNYDHFVFPGVVPRTFIGSVLLAWLSTPVILFANYLGFVSTKFDLQIIVRLVLATLNAGTLYLLRRATSRRFGHSTGVMFTLLTCSQFHIPFWMGRTLPNMYALIPVNIATYFILARAPNAFRPSPEGLKIAIALMTFTTVVFRAEVLLLLGPLVLQSLVQRHISFSSVILVGFFSGLVSLALTLCVDSYFWDKLIWPEFAGIYFNVYEGKSSEWGTSPPQEYLTTHLPKLLLSSLPLSLLGYTIDQRIRSLLIPSIVFVGLISGLAHKEWRFIVYVVPVFNIAAARGARWMVSRKKNRLFGDLLFVIVSGLIAANILVTCLLTTASNLNYPGGQALARFHEQYTPAHGSPPPHIHISNLAAQTGASLFLHLNAPPYPPPAFLAPSSVNTDSPWTYNKTEALTIASLSSAKSITHLIAETKPNPAMSVVSEWRVMGRVEGFERWHVDVNALKVGMKEISLDRVRRVLRMVVEDKLWILERSSDPQA